MLDCKKNLFSLEEGHHYLNCAYTAPFAKSVAEAGMVEFQKKNNPFQISKSDFFDPLDALRGKFAKLINCEEANRIAVIPSASYGIAQVCKNISLKPRQNVVLVENQFPSNYYSWKTLTDRYMAGLRIVGPEWFDEARGRDWNKRLLDSIDQYTAVVAIGNIHWADGTLFDLKAIREKTDEVDAMLIIDGTQSVGALPFDVREIQPDALICAAYKWLLGPYGFGLAYYGPYFDMGEPIEENWMNRKDSDKFENLAFEEEYRPGAQRYNVGQQSNFIYVNMMNAALDLLLDWTPEGIQTYCRQLVGPAVAELSAMGCQIEPEAWRANHLFGVRLPDNIDPDNLGKHLKANNVHVSMRSGSVRISPHVYNDAADMEQLLNSFRAASLGV